MQSKKKIVLSSFLILFSISLVTLTDTAFAEDATVSVPQGTSDQGCEITNECYIPYEVAITVGDSVTWINDDSAAHTVTAGTIIDGPSDIFDSGLFMAGTTFSHQFNSPGEFPYFCIVHPWMDGIIMVQGNGTTPPGTLIVGAPSEDETTVSGITEDGKVRAEITASNPSSNERMSIEIKFRDSNGGSVKAHSNYDLLVTQNGQEVYSVLEAHEHGGIGLHTTDPLNSDDPVDIKVTVLGFGLPGDEQNWSGPKGEILMFNNVPEFGTIAIVVMLAAITSVVLLSSKYNRVLPKL